MRKTEAESLRLGLITGYASVGDAVEWADRVITEDPEPDSAIVEVSLAGRRSPSDVITLLNDVPGSADMTVARRKLLFWMLRALETDSSRGSEIARWLYILAVEGHFPEDQFGYEAQLLDDAFDLAPVYGTTESATEQVRDFLREYATPGAV